MKFIAEFAPQAWQNDYAIPVDPEGDTKWDATSFVEGMLRGDEPGLDKEQARDWLQRTLQSGDIDDILAQDPQAPAWVRDWSGPFDTYLEIELT